jgi:hypothetical protein
MARNNRSGRNNNPQGRNQYNNGWTDTAKEKPLATAAAAAAAVGAGVFLWSRRNQISEQISNLSDQFSDWTQSMRSDSDSDMALAADDSTFENARSSRSGSTSRRGMSETGGGNASLGASSGGGGTTGSASGRGRARSNPTT